MLKSEIRKDYFLERYVIIAPKRNRRPHQLVLKREENLPSCFFCTPNIEKNEKTLQEVKDEEGHWMIKVIENKYPALTLDNLKAYGNQEIIVETPRHNVEIHELSLEHIVKILDIYVDRYKKMHSLPGICHTIIFKNEGGKAGASIPHSHSQIIGLPMIPPKLAKESDAIDKYTEEMGSCPYCDVIKAERKGPRVIWEDDHFFVLAPYASDSPYGAWFLPKRHVHSIELLREDEKMSLAHGLKKLLARLDDIDVPYNYFVQNSLDCESHHMLIKLSPRPNVWAGLELGTEVIINPVPPEDAVKFYQGRREI